MSERIERVLKAPMALVWELWTTPKGRASWFGPKGFEVEVLELDAVTGGAFAYTMKGHGREFTVSAVFTEVVEFKTLAWKAPMGPEDSLFTSVSFTETAEGVALVLTLEATKEGMTGGAAMGWNSSLDRLVERIG